MTPEAVEPLFEKSMDGFATLFLMVSDAKIGTSAIQTRATAGVANATYIFCLPGSPGACKDAWDEILVHQLDYRYRPCNFVEILPRLDEHLRRGEGERRDGVILGGSPRAERLARGESRAAQCSANRRCSRRAATVIARPGVQVPNPSTPPPHPCPSCASSRWRSA